MQTLWSPRPDVAQLAEGVQRGDRALLAQAITLVESNAPRHRPLAHDLLERLAPHAGRARRIGLTGVPGAGKSTLIEALGNFLCDRGHRLAVLAVDPSSAVSGGSILGDKTRMETLCRRSECFIRPSPTGGALGGVTRKTRETITLCEAAGYDVIIVETVGVGQNETAVRAMVDCFVLLLLAGAGDELQGLKKGVFELADVLLVNKADGDNRIRAETARRQFENVLSVLSPATPGWRPPVLTISGLEAAGLAEAWSAVERYFEQVEASGHRGRRRADQAVEWLRSVLAEELVARFLGQPETAARLAQAEADVSAGRLAPSVAVERLLASPAPGATAPSPL